MNWKMKNKRDFSYSASKWTEWIKCSTATYDAQITYELIMSSCLIKLDVVACDSSWYSEWSVPTTMLNVLKSVFETSNPTAAVQSLNVLSLLVGRIVIYISTEHRHTHTHTSSVRALFVVVRHCRLQCVQNLQVLFEFGVYRRVIRTRYAMKWCRPYAHTCVLQCSIIHWFAKLFLINVDVHSTCDHQDINNDTVVAHVPFMRNPNWIHIVGPIFSFLTRILVSFALI